MDMDPFTIFPRELWEKILNYLLREDPVVGSKGVLSVMHAYPVMELAFPALREHCLILQVVSVLDKRNDFSQKEIVKWRLYNKIWCGAVDAYLNSQPLNKVKNYLAKLKIDNCFPQRETRSIVKFMKDMKEHPASRNPFVSNNRLIRIKATPSLTLQETDEANTRGCQAQETFMAAVIKMLEQYGQHIRNLEFGYDSSFFGVFNNPLFWANISKMLQLFPKLKNLRLWKSPDLKDGFSVALRKLEESAFLNYLNISLLDLPHLEQLSISFSPYSTSQAEVNLWSKVVHRFASHLKKLKFYQNVDDEDSIDNDNYKFVELSPSTVSFPVLTELSCIYIFNDLYVVDHLLNIDAPSLEQLHLATGKFIEWNEYIQVNACEEKTVKWRQLLQKLKRFPVLKQFKTSHDFVEEEDLSEDDAQLSVEVVHLTDYPTATYRILLCFPNLKHLSFVTHMAPTVQDFSVNTPVKIREEIQTGQMYRSNIWELLPNLETIALLTASGEPTLLGKPFTRKEYENLKRAAVENGESDSTLEYFPLRPDIFRYLHQKAARERRYFQCDRCYQQSY